MMAEMIKSALSIQEAGRKETGMTRLAGVSWYHLPQFGGDDKSCSRDLKPKEGFRWLGQWWGWGAGVVVFELG